MAKRFEAAGMAVWGKLHASIEHACADMEPDHLVAFWRGFGHAAHAEMVNCAGKKATRALLEELLRLHTAAD